MSEKQRNIWEAIAKSSYDQDLLDYLLAAGHRKMQLSAGENPALLADQALEQRKALGKKFMKAKTGDPDMRKWLVDPSLVNSVFEVEEK